MQALRKTFVLAAALALAAACGKGNGDGGGGGPDAGYGQYKLALVGNPVLNVHPGEKRTLQVILLQDQIGAVPNAAVHFDFEEGDANNASIDNSDVSTDADGAATVHFTAGNNTQGFKLVASAPKYPQVAPKAFSVRVVPVRRLLQIVGSPQVVVSQAGDSARVTMYTSSSIALKLRELDADTGAPIPQDNIAFTLPNTSASGFSGGGSTTKTATASTNAGGEAQVFLISSGNTESNLLVTAQTNSSGAQGAVSFVVTVQAGSQGSSCTSSQNCPAGQICVSGHCQTDGGGGSCGSGTDNPCPYGYVCNQGVCQPPTQIACTPGVPGTCQPGQTCVCTNPSDPTTCGCTDICNPACQPGTHCQPGPNGGPGTCVPNPQGVPDVTGVWYTRHSFDISQALPAAVRDIFKAIRYIDQAIEGQLNLPPWLAWLNPIISKILKQYIPPWVQTIIRIGDDIGVILSQLRSEGAMNLKQGVDASHVKGTEVWTSLVFYWLPLCGDNVGGDVDVPPECARFDIATSDSDNPGEPAACKGQTVPSITVQVSPITASVAGAGTADAPWRLAVDQRKVQLQMGKVVLLVINELLTLTTPYHCIDEATDCAAGPCIVDCPGLGQWADGIVPGLGPTIEGICDTVVTAAGKAITQQLASITFDTDTLDFNGSSAISNIGADNSVCLSGTSCAGLLGNDNYARDLKKNPNVRDGKWTGAFFLKLIKNMPGAWEGLRQPLH